MGVYRSVTTQVRENELGLAKVLAGRQSYSKKATKELRRAWNSIDSSVVWVHLCAESVRKLLTSEFTSTFDHLRPWLNQRSRSPRINLFIGVKPLLLCLATRNRS